MKRTANHIVEKFTNRRGITLIEVLITAFLLFTALFAIISTTDLIVNQNGNDKMMTSATIFAKDKMELLKKQSYGYSNYTGMDNGMDYATADLTIQSTSEGALYTRSWTVSDHCPAANMKTINVNVTWSFRGKNKTVSFNTIVSP